LTSPGLVLCHRTDLLFSRVPWFLVTTRSRLPTR
jgi:hypothetical protein